MKPKYFPAAFILACTFSLPLLLSGGNPVSAAVSVGDTPEMSFKSVDGKEISLADLKGKIVLIDFWATWCGPCMAEAEHMVELNEKYGEQGLQIIGISLDQNRQALEATVKEKQFNWPQYFDGKGWGNKFSGAWGVRGIPRTFLLDTSGTVVWVGHPAQIDEPIEKAFKTTPPVLVDPEVEKLALATLDQVDAAITSGENAKAMMSLAAVSDDARKSAAVKKRVADIDVKLQAIVTTEMELAEKLIGEKKYLEAAMALATLGQAMGQSSQGLKAMQRLSELKSMPEAREAMKAADAEAKAEEELMVASDLQRAGKDDQAYARYKQIVKQFPGTESAKVAAEQIATYEKDPAFVKRANESNAGTKAKGMISLAQSYVRAGHKDKAKAKYQEVIDQFPDTSFSETAKKEQAALK